jgi:hypothetical protein
VVLAEACGRQHLPINCTNHKSVMNRFWAVLERSRRSRWRWSNGYAFVPCYWTVCSSAKRHLGASSPAFQEGGCSRK